MGVCIAKQEKTEEPQKENKNGKSNDENNMKKTNSLLPPDSNSNNEQAHRSSTMDTINSDQQITKFATDSAIVQERHQDDEFFNPKIDTLIDQKSMKTLKQINSKKYIDDNA